MVATPTSSQHDEILEALWKIDGIEEHIENTRTRPTRVLFKNQSRVEFRSLEKAQNIRSKGMHLLVVDEVQSVTQDSYESVLRPIVGATQGQILMLGQMRPHSWYHKTYYLPGQKPAGHEDNPIDFGHPRYKSFLIPSSRGPAFMTERGKLELEIARSQMARWRFELEYEGTLQGDAPDVCFPGDQITRIIKGKPLGAPGSTAVNYGNITSWHGQRFVIGLDVGKVRDVSAAVVLNIDSGQIEYTERFARGMEHAAQAKHAAALSRSWDDATLIIDGTGGGAPGQSRHDEYIQLYRDACPHHHVFHQNWQNKQAIVEGLSLAIEQQKINIPDCMTNLLDELRGYQCAYKNGLWRYYGTPDDLVSALSMAQFARQHGIGFHTGAVYRGG